MKYVILESGGKQYKVVEGGIISVDLLPRNVGDEVTFENVLLAVDDEQVQVGTPTVSGAKVLTKVLEHYKGRKILVFKYKAKQDYRVKTGHRQNYTRLQVESIILE